LLTGIMFLAAGSMTAIFAFAINGLSQYALDWRVTHEIPFVLIGAAAGFFLGFRLFRWKTGLQECVGRGWLAAIPGIERQAVSWAATRLIVAALAALGLFAAILALLEFSAATIGVLAGVFSAGFLCALVAATLLGYAKMSLGRGVMAKPRGTTNPQVEKRSDSSAQGFRTSIAHWQAFVTRGGRKQFWPGTVAVFALIVALVVSSALLGKRDVALFIFAMAAISLFDFSARHVKSAALLLETRLVNRFPLFLALALLPSALSCAALAGMFIYVACITGEFWAPALIAFAVVLANAIWFSILLECRYRGRRNFIAGYRVAIIAFCAYLFSVVAIFPAAAVVLLYGLWRVPRRGYLG
jgi:hypothetical protein